MNLNKLKHYDAVIFDLFGTLLKDYVPEDYKISQASIAKLLSVDADQFIHVWRTTRQERDAGNFGSLEGDYKNICKLFGVDASPELIRQMVEIRIDIFKRTLFPRADAVSTLSQLRALGIKVGLISDFSFEVPMLWKTLPLAPLIDYALFSCQVGKTKPDPSLYLEAAKKLGVGQERCLYVGDGGSRELTGAAQVGMQSVLIKTTDDANYPYDPAGRLDAIEWQGPIISSLTELLDLV